MCVCVCVWECLIVWCLSLCSEYLPRSAKIRPREVYACRSSIINIKGIWNMQEAQCTQGPVIVSRSASFVMQHNGKQRHICCLCYYLHPAVWPSPHAFVNQDCLHNHTDVPHTHTHTQNSWLRPIHLCWEWFVLRAARSLNPAYIMERRGEEERRGGEERRGEERRDERRGVGEESEICTNGRIRGGRGDE